MALAKVRRKIDDNGAGIPFALPATAMSLQRIFASSVAVLLVAGRFNDNADDSGCNHTTTNGLADNATFQYECSGAADPACDPPNTEPPLPEAIALGARFRLT